MKKLRNKKYKSFTLVEVLVVMGILIVLTSVGIAVGRFATQRSQDISHRDAAKTLYQALVEFKLENGYYPRHWATKAKILFSSHI